LFKRFIADVGFASFSMIFARIVRRRRSAGPSVGLIGDSDRALPKAPLGFAASSVGDGLLRETGHTRTTTVRQEHTGKPHTCLQLRVAVGTGWTPLYEGMATMTCHWRADPTLEDY
jgi:hypothetical protein